MKLRIFVFMVSCLPLLSLAGVHCSENITNAILHQNGNIYFTTSQTCPNWCQIKWTGEGDKDRAYSTLLSARATGHAITFYWVNLDSCASINPTYQSPGYMMY